MPPQSDNLDSRLITIENVHPFSGKRSKPLDLDVATLLELLPSDGTGNWLLFFEWPKAERPLTWQVKGRTKSVKVEFTDNRTKAEELFSNFGIPKPNWPTCLSAGAPTGTAFLAAEVTSATVLSFVFIIDTNPRSVGDAGVAVNAARRLKAKRGPAKPIAEAQEKADAAVQRVCPVIKVIGCQPFAGGLRYMGAERRSRIVVTPEPLTPMPGYRGYVAIDLGNTGSLLAFMAENEKDVADMKLLVLDAAREERTVPTAVRVTEYAPPKPTADGTQPMPGAQWLIGHEAVDQTGTGALILGAKRLLSGPARGSETPFHRVWLGGAEQKIPTSQPAELFLARLVQEFHASGGEQPRQIAGPLSVDDADGGTTCGLAVTCPTTFSEREILNLRRAVYSGWRRVLGGANYKFPPKNMDQVIEQVIDEASAAAMFYIYRDFVCGPGQARGFRYLYPDGINLLVYDCGGGTTDIALVHVSAVYRGDEDRVSQLLIEVIGRTGHRGFGGDDVTKAVFAVLKARAAARLSKTLKLPAATEPVKVAAAIKDQADAINKAFPTTFDPAAVDKPTTREKAAAVLELWHAAERIKAALETAPEKKGEEALTLEAETVKHFAEAVGKPTTEINLALKEAVVTRGEVDAIVRDSVVSTFERANNLIRRKLRPAGADGPGGEVHKVYVLGNASRYPLIRDGLANELDVAFLTGDGDIPGRLVFELENLKGAVARGAVAALRMRRAVDGVEMRYDNSLIKKLPFDIWLTDRGKYEQRLYREGELYDELEPKEIDPPDVTGAGDELSTGRTLFLDRQWPDEPKPHTYQTFHFPTGLVGPIQVDYHRDEDAGTAYFRMTDTGVHPPYTAISDETPEVEYVSPPQSGKL